jgi:hypothetical protein
VGLAGARVADQAGGLPGADPRAPGEGVDQRGGHAGAGVEVEVLDPLLAGEAGVAHEAGLAALLAVVAFDRQQLGQEAL